MLNTVWLSNLHRFLEDTLQVFGNIIALSASAIHSALLEHHSSQFESIGFLALSSEHVYDLIHSLLFQTDIYPQLLTLQDCIICCGGTLVPTVDHVHV